MQSPKTKAARQSGFRGVQRVAAARSSEPSLSPSQARIVQLQRSAGNQAVTQLMQVQSEESGIGSRRSGPNVTGMPDQLKSGLESLSGMDLSDVRVHRNSGLPSQLNALAFAEGSNIHLVPGQERHLPHEGWHVVQQKQGRVRPTMQLKSGQAINDDQSLEQEADRMGQKALTVTGGSLQERHQAAQADPAGNRTAQRVVQRAVMHNTPIYTEKNGRAGKVTVENIHGTPLGLGANAPRVDVFGWPELIKDGHTLGNVGLHNSHYNAVRMHLWNGRLGGPGNDHRNLAPGPALVNSSMSAGPEAASKDAVSAGESIWLETEVWYKEDKLQRNDFRSVIPNKMKMSWGYMKSRGKAEPPAWEMKIDQPEGALTADEQKRYKQVKSAKELDDMLDDVSDQEMAQAYSLVTPELQKHMLLQYDSIYNGMQESDRETVLSGMTADEIHTLIDTLQINGDHIAVYYQIIVPLLRSSAKLQQLFTSFSDKFQERLLKYGGWELLRALGEMGIKLAREQRTIFNLMPDSERYKLLGRMSASQIGILLKEKADSKLLQGWANDQGLYSTDKIELFLKPRLSPKLFGAFERNCLKWLRYKEARIRERREAEADAEGEFVKRRRRY